MDSYRDHVGLWADELKAWVPDRIFDAHVHLGRKEDVVKGFSAERRRNALTTFSHLTLDEMRDWHGALYSGKEVAGVFAFPFPLQEVDFARANAYIAETMKACPAVKGFLWTNQKDLKLTIDSFKAAERRGARFMGAKPYYDLLGKSNFDTSMEEILPRRLLEFIDAERLVLMLHTTGKGVGDGKVRAYLQLICDDFPHVRIALAHMGRHLSVADFEAFMGSALRENPAVFLEMSSSSEAEIYRMVLADRQLRGRLLFGSDIPFGLITGMERWSDTAGAIFQTRDKYSWSEDGSHGYQDMTYNSYHVLKALKDAMESLALSQEESSALKSGVFLDNALNLVGCQ